MPGRDRTFDYFPAEFICRQLAFLQVRIESFLMPGIQKFIYFPVTHILGKRLPAPFKVKVNEDTSQIEYYCLYHDCLY